MLHVGAHRLLHDIPRFFDSLPRAVVLNFIRGSALDRLVDV